MTTLTVHGARMVRTPEFGECVAAIIACGGADALDRLLDFTTLTLVCDEMGKLDAAGDAHKEFVEFIDAYDATIVCVIAAGMGNCEPN